MVRATALTLVALLLAACASKPKIVVGSKNFTEQLILGEILAQHIERRLKVPVERKFNLGGTLLAHQALTTGAIDLYPEYTGTALTAILKHGAVKDAVSVLRQVRADYENQWRLKWLEPFGFNNTFAMVVRCETARQSHLSTLSDAARSNIRWNLGVGYEFLQRSDGLDGLLRTYGLKLAGAPVSMDLGLLYTALQGQKVNMVAANSTDGMLSVLDAKVLTDDRAYFPPYQCAPVVRSEILARYPGLQTAIEEIAGMITDEQMRKLNYAVDGQHKSVQAVASEFLNQGKKERLRP